MRGNPEIELRKELELAIWNAGRHRKKQIKEKINRVNTSLSELEGNDNPRPFAWNSVAMDLSALSIDLANAGVAQLAAGNAAGWQFVDESVFMEYYALRFDWVSSQKVDDPYRTFRIPVHAARVLCAGMVWELESVVDFSKSIIEQSRSRCDKIWQGRRDLECSLLYLLGSDSSISQEEMGVYADCVDENCDGRFEKACDGHIHLLREMFSKDDIAALAGAPLNVLPWDAEAIARIKGEPYDADHQLTQWAPPRAGKKCSFFENRFEPMMIRMEMVLPAYQPLNTEPNGQ